MTGAKKVPSNDENEQALAQLTGAKNMYGVTADSVDKDAKSGKESPFLKSWL